MTDRYNALIVVLDKDIREDDAQATIVNAIRCIKGVNSVVGNVSDIHETVAKSRLKTKILEELIRVIENF